MSALHQTIENSGSLHEPRNLSDSQVEPLDAAHEHDGEQFRRQQIKEILDNTLRYPSDYTGRKPVCQYAECGNLVTLVTFAEGSRYWRCDEHPYKRSVIVLQSKSC